MLSPSELKTLSLDVGPGPTKLRYLTDEVFLLIFSQMTLRELYLKSDEPITSVSIVIIFWYFLHLGISFKYAEFRNFVFLNSVVLLNCNSLHVPVFRHYFLDLFGSQLRNSRSVGGPWLD